MKTQKKSTNDHTTNVNTTWKILKNHDLRICTWNVRSINKKADALTQLVKVLENYKVDIIAMQEMRLKTGIEPQQGSYWLYYENHTNTHEFGCGFLITERLKNHVLKFKPVNERLCVMRLRAKFFNISLICVHALTESHKIDEDKDLFYKQLDDTYQSCPKHDVKIVLGDFNAKIGKEGTFGTTVGKFCYHVETSANGRRLINFASSQNMVISSTMFQHKKIHLETHLSPKKEKSQKDFVLIDGRHASSIMDVRAVPGADIGSDHSLVLAKVRARVCVAKNKRNQAREKLDVRKLESQEISKSYADRLSQVLEKTLPVDNVNTQWIHICHSLRIAGKQLGFYRPSRNDWYDEGCHKAAVLKNAAYDALKVATEKCQEYKRAGQKQRKILQAYENFKIAEEIYREKRREEKRIFKRMKREQEKRECEALHNIDEFKFFKKVKEGLKTRASTYKDKNGNLVRDTKDLIRLWRNHFSTLRSNVDPNIISGETATSVAEDHVNISPPNYDEVCAVFLKFKENKPLDVYGLPVELFTAGGEVLMRYMHQLLCRIWTDESMPNDWNVGILRPIHKKGDPTICANYRDIGLINIGYKFLSLVMCERLSPYLNEQIGPYQCGYRPGKSTIDQIFTLRQIMEKTYEFQVDTDHLFLKYKAPFDSPIRHCLYETMFEFDIPVKLIRLCMMTLNNTQFSVQIGNDYSVPFNTKRGFRQGDCLSFHFFNLMMEKIVRKAGVIQVSTIFNKDIMLLAYGVNLDIIGKNGKYLSDAASAIIAESQRMGLEVDKNKTKYFFSQKDETSQRKTAAKNNIQTKYSLRSSSTGLKHFDTKSSLESQEINEKKIKCLQFTVNENTYKFEPVKHFVYLNCIMTNTGNRVSLEINRRIYLANRCYFRLSRHFNNKTLSRQRKKTLYQSRIKPILLYGAETWTLCKDDENGLKAFEKKILFKIYDPVFEDDKLYKLYNDVNIIDNVKIKRIEWLDYVKGLKHNEPIRKLFDSNPIGKRKRGVQCPRWQDQVRTDMNNEELTRINNRFPNAVRHLHETGK